MLQLPVGSWRHVACGTRHAALVAALLAQKANKICLQKLALNVAPQFSLIDPLLLPFPFRSTTLLHFLLSNKHLFVCFSISERALFIRHTRTHRQSRKYSRCVRVKGRVGSGAICPGIDIKIAWLLSLWHSDNLAHLCCLLLCAVCIS